MQDKKKKKKKGKKDPAAAPAAASAAPISAAARAILQRRQALEEEEARIKKLQDAENERVRLEEEKIAAEEKAAEEEKERRRKAKLEKKEAQVAAGTFMTKAEKEKQKKLQARLESLKAAGVALPSADAAPAAPVKASDLYKKPAAKNAAKKVEEVKEVVVEATPSPTSAGVESTAEVADDWDADDDWESNLEAITINLEVRILYIFATIFAMCTIVVILSYDHRQSFAYWAICSAPYHTNLFGTA